MGQREPFKAGKQFDYAGMRLSVGKGHKTRRGQGDLILWWLASDGEWHPVSMDILWLCCRFLYENEDRLYPPELGFKGGEMFLEATVAAMRDSDGPDWQNTKLTVDKNKPGGTVHCEEPRYEPFHE